MSHDLWTYCTSEHIREMILDLNLTGSLRQDDPSSIALLYHLSNHPESHYSVRHIRGKNGKCRTLHVPDRLLCTVQRRILRNVLDSQSAASCAFAYEKGKTLLDNALPHVGKGTILKLDIQDFFNNITYISVYQHAFPAELFPPPIRALLTSLCCYKDVLPQGAPTSPKISNLVMKPFDCYMADWCTEHGITYTRYCDDMTFSGDFCVKEVLHKAQSFLLRMGFSLNRKKTNIQTCGHRQRVTGLVVNQTVHPPREYRRSLRQEWYYIQKYGVAEHLRRTNSSLSVREYLVSTAGKIAYVRQINPEDAYFQHMQKEITQLLKETAISCE